MATRRRRILLLVAALLAAAAVAVLVWLPFDPFEEPAGPLDTLVPADADSAWRCDGASLLRSPLARAAWDRPAVRALRSRWEVEERFLAPMRRIQSAVSDASLGALAPPSLETDLVPAEVVVATRGGAVLVATRISRRARAIELVRKLPAGRSAELGIRIDGDDVVLGADTATPVRVRRHRDVLLASNARDLLDDAFALSDGRGDSLAALPAYGDALHLGRPAGSRIFGWVRPAAVARHLRALYGADGADATDASGEDDAPMWRAPLAEMLAAKDAAPVRVELDLSSADALAATWTLAWAAALPEALAPLGVSSAPGAASLAARARAYAPPGETVVAGGLAASGSAVLRALLASQPPERQGAFEEALAAAGESIDGIARSLAAHFDDGVGFVVARLREADDVLQGDDAGLVHAIPATLVAFRMHGAGVDRAVLEALNRRAETLFGQPLGDTVEVLGDGTRIHTLRRTGLAGQWEFLRPAFAFRGDDFVFATHEGFLRRALAYARSDAGRAAAASTPDAGDPPSAAGASTSAAGGSTSAAGASTSAAGAVVHTLALDLACDPLHRWMDDQAWEFADRTTWRDWAHERRRAEEAMPPDPAERPAAREARIDARIREIKRIRLSEEIPAAAAAWRARWQWLDSFGAARAAMDFRGGAVEFRAEIRFAESR